jgi:uncharacterized membrane protein
MAGQKLGHISFPLAIGAVGILNLLMRNFYSTSAHLHTLRLYPLLEFFFWLAIIVLSGGILISNKPHIHARRMGWFILIWIFLRHSPLLISDLTNPSEWNFACMACAICGSAFIVASSYEKSFPRNKKESDPSMWSHPPVLPGQTLIGLPLLMLGFQHLYYAEFLSSMIPAWIPMKITWAWITGIVLAGVGFSFLLNIKVLWTSFVLTVMLISWIILLHLPRIVSHPRDFFEWIYAFQAFAIAAGGWVLYGIQKKLAEPLTTESVSFMGDQILTDLKKQALEQQTAELYILRERQPKNYTAKGSKRHSNRSETIK